LSAPAYSLRRDCLLWTLVAVLGLVTAAHPGQVTAYPALVDWPTIATLAGLLLLTAGIEVSGFLHLLAVRLLHHVHDERQLALFLLSGSALFAALLTNDIALFIVVPFTLSLRRYAVLPLRRLIIFEAFAVNAGSALTPIGNPQNIYLWQSSGVHFHSFVAAMWPPVLVAGLTLVSFALFAFKPRPLELEVPAGYVTVDRTMFIVSALLFTPFLVLADMRFTGLALLLVAAVYLMAFRGVWRRLDWPLLVVFMLMFVDLRLLAELSWVRTALAALDLKRPETLYLTGALLSQAISNVPATILLSPHSADWRTLAWAVDVGGFGLVVGSLANLIALRLGRQPGSLWAFHAWSLPYFLLILAITGLWLRAGGG
jgi:Na+/H+ antiporter NhaD/arsenite permease-like protein